jgi:hypothetical protein
MFYYTLFYAGMQGVFEDFSDFREFSVFFGAFSRVFVTATGGISPPHPRR